MRVAFLFLHPFSSSLGSTVRVRELTNHLGQFNVESFIFTPYEKTQILNDGVKVISFAGLLQKYGLSKYFYRLTKFVYYNSFFIKYFMTSKTVQGRFAKNNAIPIIKALKQNPVDIIQVEQDFALPTAIEVKKRTGLPLVADLHNITSEELVSSGTIKQNSTEFSKLQNMLRYNLNQVDAVVVVSDLMKKYVVNNFGLPTECVIVVPPGANPGERAKNVSKNPKIVYSGLVSYREHVDLFVKSMPFIQEKVKGVEFYITNKGENLKTIKKLAKQLNVNPVFFWYPKKEDFVNFLSSCDVAVLPSSNDLARQMGTPVKLFDYLAIGLPVVANDIGGWTTSVKREKTGLLTEDNPKDFARGVIELIQNKVLYYSFVKTGSELVKKKMNWDSSAKLLSNKYEDLIGTCPVFK